MVLYRLLRSARLLTLIFVLAMIPTLAGAQATPPATPAPPSFLLEPANQDNTYFSVTMEPGTSQQLAAVMGNAGTAPVEARTYVADAYTLVNGGFGVETEDDPASEPTTWIDYSAETLDLAAGEALERAFSVTVPEGTPPGQYISGLVIQTADSIAVGNTEMLRQIIKKSIAVFITVPGPVTPELRIGEARIQQIGEATTLVVETANPGNVFLNPAGTVTMTTAASDPVLDAPVTMGTVYAGTSTTLELFIPTQLAPGNYNVSVSLHDAETGASAEAANLDVTVAPPVEATPVAESVTFDAVSIEPLNAPSSDQLQAVNVSVTLNNPGEAVPSASLTLNVSRNDELVEAYPLYSSLVLPNGATELQQRYVPLEGWQSGTYTFELVLEAVDPNTGQATVLASYPVEETIDVP